MILPRVLEKYIISETSERKHPYAALREKEWKKLPSFTEEEILIGLAAHEIRHLVQKEYSINLIIPENEKKTTDPELKLLIRFIAEVFKEMPEEDMNPQQQFDAVVIEWFIARLWREGMRDLSKLAKIIKEDGERIIEKRGIIPSSLFPIFLF